MLIIHDWIVLAIGVYSTSVSAYLYGVFELDTVSYIHSSCVRVTSGIAMSISWNFQYFFAFGQSIFVSHALNRSKFTTTQHNDTHRNRHQCKWIRNEKWSSEGYSRSNQFSYDSVCISTKLRAVYALVSTENARYDCCQLHTRTHTRTYTAK